MHERFFFEIFSRMEWPLIKVHETDGLQDPEFEATVAS